MRKLFACAVISVATASAQNREDGATGIREKLLSKMMEDAQAFAAKPTREVKEPGEPVIVMERLTIVESVRDRQLEAAIERDERRNKAEKFSITTGGTLYKRGSVEIGGWSDSKDWVFLRKNW